MFCWVLQGGEGCPPYPVSSERIYGTTINSSRDMVMRWLAFGLVCLFGFSALGVEYFNYYSPSSIMLSRGGKDFMMVNRMPVNVQIKIDKVDTNNNVKAIFWRDVGSPMDGDTAPYFQPTNSPSLNVHTMAFLSWDLDASNAWVYIYQNVTNYAGSIISNTWYCVLAPFDEEVGEWPFPDDGSLIINRGYSTGHAIRYSDRTRFMYNTNFTWTAQAGGTTNIVIDPNTEAAVLGLSQIASDAAAAAAAAEALASQWRASMQQLSESQDSRLSDMGAQVVGLNVNMEAVGDALNTIGAGVETANETLSSMDNHLGNLAYGQSLQGNTLSSIDAGILGVNTKLDTANGHLSNLDRLPNIDQSTSDSSVKLSSILSAVEAISLNTSVLGVGGGGVSISGSIDIKDQTISGVELGVPHDPEEFGGMIPGASGESAEATLTRADVDSAKAEDIEGSMASNVPQFELSDCEPDSFFGFQMPWGSTIGSKSNLLVNIPFSFGEHDFGGNLNLCMPAENVPAFRSMLGGLVYIVGAASCALIGRKAFSG